MAPEGPFHLAIELGPGTGRALLGRIEASGVRIEEVHRFAHSPARRQGYLRWDFRAVLGGMRAGLAAGARAAASARAELGTVGVHSWGADYGLVDAAGRLLEDPISFRDPRTEGAMERVLRRVPREDIFQRTGVAFSRSSTLFQLEAHVREGLPAGARRLLMIPDLCHQALCGAAAAEATNAFSTQLLDVRTRRWADDLFSRLGLPRELMPDLVGPGTRLGELRPALQAELGIGPVVVAAPATHETASAFAGAPIAPGWACVSTGASSTVGVEREVPLVNAEVADQDLTNAEGASGRALLLRSVSGLALLDACRQEWEERGLLTEANGSLAAAAAIERPPGLVFPDHPRFLGPVSVTAEIQAALVETGQRVPDDPARLARVVLDSLAHRYASVVRTIERLTGETIRGVGIVGDACQIDHLCQATADACGRPVLAGPGGPAAVGSVLVQAIASGEIESLEAGRRLVARSFPLRRFEPREHAGQREAIERYREIEGRYR
jgi:rhamnulokinase